MGGTFDPIHYGHLVTAEEARAQFRLDKMLFIPTGVPPHKVERPDVSEPEHRYLMTVLATATHPHFVVSRMEIDRKGPSYTIETVRELHREMGSDLELFFVTGADAVMEILTWRQPEQIVKLARFIAATRPGYPMDRFHELADEGIAKAVTVMEVPALAISSSDIRARVRDGRPIRFLTPDPVAVYVAKNGLYGGGGRDAGGGRGAGGCEEGA